MLALSHQPPQGRDPGRWRDSLGTAGGACLHQLSPDDLHLPHGGAGRSLAGPEPRARNERHHQTGGPPEWARRWRWWTSSSNTPARRRDSCAAKTQVDPHRQAGAPHRALPLRCRLILRHNGKVVHNARPANTVAEQENVALARHLWLPLRCTTPWRYRASTATCGSGAGWQPRKEPGRRTICNTPM